MDHDEQSGESLGAMLSGIAATLRSLSEKLDAAAAKVNDERGTAERLAKLEAWAFRTDESFSAIVEPDSSGGRRRAPDDFSARAIVPASGKAPAADQYPGVGTQGPTGTTPRNSPPRLSAPAEQDSSAGRHNSPGSHTTARHGAPTDEPAAVDRNSPAARWNPNPQARTGRRRAPDPDDEDPPSRITGETNNTAAQHNSAAIERVVPARPGADNALHGSPGLGANAARPDFPRDVNAAHGASPAPSLSGTGQPGVPNPSAQNSTANPQDSAGDRNAAHGIPSPGTGVTPRMSPSSNVAPQHISPAPGSGTAATTAEFAALPPLYNPTATNRSGAPSRSTATSQWLPNSSQQQTPGHQGLPGPDNSTPLPSAPTGETNSPAPQHNSLTRGHDSLDRPGVNPAPGGFPAPVPNGVDQRGNTPTADVNGAGPQHNSPTPRLNGASFQLGAPTAESGPTAESNSAAERSLTQNRIPTPRRIPAADLVQNGAPDQHSGPDQHNAVNRPSVLDQPSALDRPSALDQPSVPDRPSALDQPSVPDRPSVLGRPSASDQHGTLGQGGATQSWVAPVRSSDPGTPQTTSTPDLDAGTQIGGHTANSSNAEQHQQTPADTAPRLSPATDESAPPRWNGSTRASRTAAAQPNSRTADQNSTPTPLSASENGAAPDSTGSPYGSRRRLAAEGGSGSPRWSELIPDASIAAVQNNVPEHTDGTPPSWSLAASSANAAAAAAEKNTDTTPPWKAPGTETTPRWSELTPDTGEGAPFASFLAPDQDTPPSYPGGSTPERLTTPGGYPSERNGTSHPDNFDSFGEPPSPGAAPGDNTVPRHQLATPEPTAGRETTSPRERLTSSGSTTFPSAPPDRLTSPDQITTAAPSDNGVTLTGGHPDDDPYAEKLQAMLDDLKRTAATPLGRSDIFGPPTTDAEPPTPSTPAEPTRKYTDYRLSGPPKNP